MSVEMNQISGNQPQKRSLMINLGLILFIPSSLLFGFSAFSDKSNEDLGFTVFLACYACTFLYWLTLLFHKEEGSDKRVRLSNLDYNIMLLLLGNVSAYALNRILPVFHESVNWLTVYLILLNLSLLGFIFRKDRRPDLINHILVAIISSGVLFSLYQSIYVLPLYGITAISFWFFGISLHSFIPLLYLIITIKIIRRYYKTSSQYQYPIVVGITLPALLILGFAYRFYHINESFRAAYAMEEKVPGDFPAWVDASQHIPTGWMTERVLNSGIHYAVVDENFFNAGFDALGRRGRNLKHDPLIVFSSACSKKLNISFPEREKLLKTIYNERHSTERRLWSGDKLSTETIETNVKIYPAHRLAYTEKTLTIKNNNSKNRWRGRQQEALYSFYLPEGSVVTSASLWIEGEEQKAILTTRAKADSAYQTIVGRERRDPLLVHWQEGNRISARIFPCTPEVNRIFKLGFTSPLTYDENVLKYQNVDFEGPDFTFAEETIDLKCDNWPENFDAALGFKQTNDGYHYDGRYRSDWIFTCSAPPLETTPFYFEGEAVEMENYEPKTISFHPEKIYLDIHRNWSKKEIKEVLDLTKDKPVYVFAENRMIQLEDFNRSRLIKELRKNNYTLFPFYKIPKDEKVLVITHDGRLTPELDDLKSTEFYKKLSADFLNRTEPIPVFHLGDDPSPYLKTLNELRNFNFFEGEMPDFVTYFDSQTFPASGEDENTIVLNEAKVTLSKKTDTAPAVQKSPDHLWRLYAYNNVMRQMGKDYFRKDQHHQDLIVEAEEAYVVSPISSLVTLETQKDYDRFDIKKSNKTLGNADLGDGGAVPEPGEWFLIIFGLLVGGWLVYKR